jgi:prepilin-type N-terminal cleavage/methylation domain-containing protein
MQTLASFRLDRMKGFTLLELLVVMMVVGLVAAMAGPNLERMFAGVDKATRRDGLVVALSGLSFRAYSLGEGFVLSNATQRQLLADGDPLLSVPKGWRVVVDSPIRFDLNGWCTGGLLQLVSPDDVVERLRLDAPDCRVHRV